ncbi:GIY-YIG nuclease family protein [Corynebacterium propinquum]|nr:GIY-YIG nuclease family protein [Corynebacterium propinquum]WKS32933.1 GIY-YIG nuclease family protein [Corynebacterium propinquum]WKS37249.1 GIY-YIG nuclease family protein [Corynebacterium propinquum]WKS43358.1 GIY-YIG nuclease family protein [Corynebacterium propinquum]WKS47600.1 GIY-YIG nuclease family protein [Corynebacterium propinquum]
MVAESDERTELKQSGIYLLLGADDETGEERLYVGQARERKNGNGVLGRVQEHLNSESKNYFTHAILIIDSDNSFGPTEISYLENSFYEQAQSAGRVRVVNSNIPSPGNVTEEKQAALDEFIATAKILIGSLGYHAFDTVDDGKSATQDRTETSPPSVEPLLFLDSAGATGQGRQTNDGFVVLEGAQLREQVKASMPELAHKNRERLAGRINERFELTRDTLFPSPSAASSFLVGASTSGKVYWKTKDGITLRELEQRKL